MICGRRLLPGGGRSGAGGCSWSPEVAPSSHLPMEGFSRMWRIECSRGKKPRDVEMNGGMVRVWSDSVHRLTNSGCHHAGINGGVRRPANCVNQAWQRPVLLRSLGLVNCSWTTSLKNWHLGFLLKMQTAEERTWVWRAPVGWVRKYHAGSQESWLEA